MKVYLVFERELENLLFKASYKHLESAIKHAQLVHLHANAEVHEVCLHDNFSKTCVECDVSTVLWTSFTHSGAV